MRSAIALGNRLRSFILKLILAVPANLAIFWLVLHGDTTAILLYGCGGGLAGALLLTALERPSSPRAVRTAAKDGRQRATVHEFPQHPRPA